MRQRSTVWRPSGISTAWSAHSSSGSATPAPVAPLLPASAWATGRSAEWSNPELQTTSGSPDGPRDAVHSAHPPQRHRSTAHSGNSARVGEQIRGGLGGLAAGRVFRFPLPRLLQRRIVGDDLGGDGLEHAHLAIADAVEQPGDVALHPLIDTRRQFLSLVGQMQQHDTTVAS